VRLGRRRFAARIEGTKPIGASSDGRVSVDGREYGPAGA
jgi:hypothetical protein